MRQGGSRKKYLYSCSNSLNRLSFRTINIPKQTLTADPVFPDDNDLLYEEFLEFDTKASLSSVSVVSVVGRQFYLVRHDLNIVYNAIKPQYKPNWKNNKKKKLGEYWKKLKLLKSFACYVKKASENVVYCM